MSKVMSSSEPREMVSCWVELYSDALYSWAFYKTSSKETAEDLVQETFIAALAAFSKFQRDSNPKTWLLSILNHKISDHFRKKYRDIVSTDDHTTIKVFASEGDDSWRLSEAPKDWGDSDPHLLDDSEFRNTLQSCLEKLPENWRSAVHLKYMEERSGESICQDLSISPTNFWQILHRSKLQLRKCIELNWFGK